MKFEGSSILEQRCIILEATRVIENLGFSRNASGNKERRSWAWLEFLKENGTIIIRHG
jgi:hypothetical protein